MADGGIAGYDEDVGMADGGMFNYARAGGPVLSMSGGGGGITEMRKLILKELGETTTNYLQNPDTKRTVDKLVQERLGTAGTTAATATPSAVTTLTKEGVLYKPAKAVGEVVKYGKGAVKGLPVVGGALSTYEGLSDLNKNQGFLNDPNVSALDKAKQTGLTSIKTALPIAGAGLGTVLTAGPWGTVGGGLAGTAAANYFDFDSDALKEWQKANPQATPEQTKKAAAKITPTYSPDDQSNPEAQRLGLKVNRNTMSKLPEAADVAPTGGAGGKGGAGGQGGAGGTSAQSIKDMYALFAGPQNVRDTQLNEIERMYKESAESKTAAAQRYYDQLQADIAAQGEYGKNREAKLKSKEERIGKEEGQAGGLALLEAGLAIMGGTSQNAFTNIGQGAMAGTAAYRKSQERLADARDKLDDAYGRLEDVRFNQKNMNAAELRSAKKDIDNATNAGLDSLINMAAKRFDISTDQAKTMFGGAINLEQSRIAAAPGLARNAMLQKQFEGDQKKMVEYGKLQKQVMADLEKDIAYKTASTPEAKTKIMEDRLRAAMLNNPFLSSYAMGIGFESAPKSKVRNEAEEV